jgi:hypothetical protein
MFFFVGLTMNQWAWVEFHSTQARWQSSQKYCLPHTYTLLPDDGLLIPKISRDILIQQTKDNQCMKLVIIHIY